VKKNFDYIYRQETIDNFPNEEYDILIIGGGITGAGLLLDATARGYKALLVEKSDFATGTSSRSTKLIHGGLRYLKSFQIKIVRDTGRERAIAYKNAPHLVLPEKMVLPIEEGGTFGKLGTSIGLWVYDRLAGVVKSERRKMLNKETTLQKEPGLNPKLLKGSGFYSEYRTDDARLTIEIIKTAFEKGANALNYTEVSSLLYENKKTIGANIIDTKSGKTHQVKAKYVINATGPWSDNIRKLDKSMNHKKLHLTKGVHIVVPHSKLPINNSVYFDVQDGRMIFAIPRGRVTYIGTTDTNYTERIENPAVSKEDVSYLISATNKMFPDCSLINDDVESSWAGLRPLIHEDGKSPSQLSRKDEIFLSDSGLITIAGGKLTGYRLMAKKVIDIINKRAGKNTECSTQRINIKGSVSIQNEDLSPIEKDIKNKCKNTFNLTDVEINYLINNYGDQSAAIIDSALENKTDLITSEAHFCIANELTTDLLDFFIRHTGRMYFNLPSVQVNLNKIATIFATELKWDEAEKEKQIAAVYQEISERNTFK